MGKSLKRGTFAAVLLVFLLQYQNCANATLPALNTFGKFNSLLPPPPPEAVLNYTCMTDSQYNACVFLKNPVAEKRSPFSPATTYSTDLSQYQIYAVNLKTPDPTALKNSSIKVLAGAGGAITPVNGAWKFVYANDSAHRVGQVMAYYWLNYQIDYMKSRVGNFYAEGKNIEVNAFDSTISNNAQWDQSSNNIRMGVFNIAGQSEAALSADIYAHEMGHANQSYANPNFMNWSTSTHKMCNSNVCCTTVGGCAGGIAEGQADYHSFITFGTTAAIGEQVVNSTSGISQCGIARRAAANVNLLMSQAFNACSGLAGEVHAMGNVYASIWWQLRDGAANPLEIDQLFNEHLKVIGGSDTYVTAVPKILAIDASVFGGKYNQSIKTEFSRRGITTP